MKKLITLIALAVMLAGCDNVSMAQYRRQPLAAAQVSQAEPSKAETQPTTQTNLIEQAASFELSTNVIVALMVAVLFAFFGWVFTGGYAKDRHGNPR
jgi:PBP1b-binding outer membrane lipoprotein LpoB